MTAPSYTQEDVDALLSKMALERGKLIAAAEALSDAEADRVPSTQWARSSGRPRNSSHI